MTHSPWSEELNPFSINKNKGGFMEKVLSTSGIGQTWGDVLESGLVLAEAYFEEHKLDFLECFEAYENSDLGKHWLTAKRKADLALYASNIQDDSMIILEVE